MEGRQIVVRDRAALEARARREIENRLVPSGTAVVPRPAAVALRPAADPLRPEEPPALFAPEQMMSAGTGLARRPVDDAPTRRGAESASVQWRATHPAPPGRVIRKEAASGAIPAWEDARGRVFVRGDPALSRPGHEEVFFVSAKPGTHPRPQEILALTDQDGRTWHTKVLRTLSTRPHQDGSVSVWVHPLIRSDSEVGSWNILEKQTPIERAEAGEPSILRSPQKRARSPPSLARLLEEIEDEIADEPDEPPDLAFSAPSEPPSLVISEPPLTEDDTRPPSPDPRTPAPKKEDGTRPGFTGAPAARPRRSRRKKH